MIFFSHFNCVDNFNWTIPYGEHMAFKYLDRSLNTDHRKLAKLRSCTVLNEKRKNMYVSNSREKRTHNHDCSCSRNNCFHIQIVYVAQAIVTQLRLVCRIAIITKGRCKSNDRVYLLYFEQHWLRINWWDFQVLRQKRFADCFFLFDV